MQLALRPGVRSFTMVEVSPLGLTTGSAGRARRLPGAAPFQEDCAVALPLNAIIEASFQGRLLGQTTISVYHYRVFATSTIATVFSEIQGFLEAFNNAGTAPMAATYLACTPENFTLETAVAQAVFPLRFRRVSQVVDGSGTLASASVSNVQASILFQSEMAGRSQVGGKRIPLSPNNADAGMLDFASKVKLQDHADQCLLALAAPLGGGIYTPCIYHRGPNATPKFHDIFSAAVQPTTRVIRRRTVGLGI